MEGLRNRIVCGCAGAVSGLAGMLSLSKCSGSACTSCFGCVAAGAGILLVTLLNKSKEVKERQNGVA